MLSLFLDCQQTDIAFLLDGSGSISQQDFTTMKNFVINMVNGLKDRDFQVCAERALILCITTTKESKHV